MTKEKMVKIPVLLIWGLSLSFQLSTCSKSSSNAIARNRIIEPRESVGAITRNSSEQELIAIYGQENVSRDKISLGEGFSIEGTIIYQGKPDEVKIEWHKDFKAPQRLTISSPNTSWQTQEKITIGTTLEELEKINGRSFQLTGWAWDYEGRTTSWQEGKLPQELQLRLEPTVEIEPSEYQKVMGDGLFDSHRAEMKKLKPVVKEIYIRWDK